MFGFYTFEENAKSKKKIDDKNAECENLKKSLADEVLKNANLQNCLDKQNSEIEKLQSQITEQNFKNTNFDSFANTLKSDILNISSKIDDVQNLISEITKKNSNGIIGLLKND